MYVCPKTCNTPPSKFKSSRKAQKRRMSQIVDVHKRFCLKSQTEIIQAYGGITNVRWKLVQGCRPGDTEAAVAILDKSGL